MLKYIQWLTKVHEKCELEQTFFLWTSQCGNIPCKMSPHCFHGQFGPHFENYSWNGAIVSEMWTSQIYIFEHKSHRLWLYMQGMLVFSCNPLVCYIHCTRYSCLWEKPSLDGPHNVTKILVKWPHIDFMDKSAYIVL